MDELADGTGGSVDAVTGAAIGPYWKSRFKGVPEDEKRLIVRGNVARLYGLSLS